MNPNESNPDPNDQHADTDLGPMLDAEIKRLGLTEKDLQPPPEPDFANPEFVEDEDAEDFEAHESEEKNT